MSSAVHQVQHGNMGSRVKDTRLRFNCLEQTVRRPQQVREDGPPRKNQLRQDLDQDREGGGGRSKDGGAKGGGRRETLAEELTELKPPLYF